MQLIVLSSDPIWIAPHFNALKVGELVLGGVRYVGGFGLCSLVHCTESVRLSENDSPIRSISQAK